MNVDAFLFSGRMVASARQKPAVIKNRKPTKWYWQDSREVGGVYERLEEWMRIVQLEQGNEIVSFRIRDES